MAPSIYHFGEFELDVPRLELRLGGQAVPLQPKALELLVYLVRHRDRVVSRDELLSSLWPDVVVTEASLSKAVYAARRALGEPVDGQEWIVTLRGRGFRFAAPVAAAEAEPDPAAAAEAASVRMAKLGAMSDAAQFCHEVLRFAFRVRRLQQALRVASEEHFKSIWAYARGELAVHEGYDHSYYFVASFLGEHLAFHAERLR